MNAAEGNARRLAGVRPEQLARMFHEAYEELAPSLGYETRAESAVQWEDVPEANWNLMVQTAALVLSRLPLADPPGEQEDALAEPLRQLRLAFEFYDQCLMERPSTELGCYSDALDWIESAARKVNDTARNEREKSGRPPREEL